MEEAALADRIVVLDNGKAILEDILVAGDYTVIATYMGDSRFNTNITAESFTIKGHVKQDTAIDANNREREKKAHQLCLKKIEECGF